MHGSCRVRDPRDGTHTSGTGFRGPERPSVSSLSSWSQPLSPTLFHRGRYTTPPCGEGVHPDTLDRTLTDRSTYPRPRSRCASSLPRGPSLPALTRRCRHKVLGAPTPPLRRGRGGEPEPDRRTSRRECRGLGSVTSVDGRDPTAGPGVSSAVQEFCGAATGAGVVQVCPLGVRPVKGGPTAPRSTAAPTASRRAPIPVKNGGGERSLLWWSQRNGASGEWRVFCETFAPPPSGRGRVTSGAGVPEGRGRRRGGLDPLQKDQTPDTPLKRK